MEKGQYTDISIITSRYFLKLSGAWYAMNNAEERCRKISLGYVISVGTHFLFLNYVNICTNWGRDINSCIFSCCNMLLILLAMLKVIILRIHRFKLADLVAYAERHFWHYNYDPEEKLIFAKCQTFCKYWAAMVFSLPPAALSGYVTSPIISSIGKNKSDRDLPVNIVVSSLYDTPYYELLFTFQSISTFVTGIAYVAPDYFLCILNAHVICQFRILQHRMIKFWKSSNQEMDSIKYIDQCSVGLKNWVQQHQSLIEFCEKLEYVFTYTILWHMVVFSLLMGLNGYEILLSDASMLTRSIFLFHTMGSIVHLIIFSSTCHGIMEESTNMCVILYSVPWSTLPMNKVGKSLRSNIRMIMVRSLKPCCLTAGGYFPVSLETATTLISSAVSYFTLLRNSFV